MTKLNINTKNGPLLSSSLLREQSVRQLLALGSRSGKKQKNEKLNQSSNQIFPAQNYLTQTFQSVKLESQFLDFYYMKRWRFFVTLLFLMGLTVLMTLMADVVAFSGNRTAFIMIIGTVRIPVGLILVQSLLVQIGMLLIEKLLHHDRDWKKHRIWNILSELHYFVSCFSALLFTVYRHSIYGFYGVFSPFPVDIEAGLFLCILVIFPRVILFYIFMAIAPLAAILAAVFNPDKVFSHDHYWISFLTYFTLLLTSLMFNFFVEKRLRRAFVLRLQMQVEAKCASQELVRSNRLKANIFPLVYQEGFAKARREHTFYKHNEHAVVLFSDIVSFSLWCLGKPAEYIVKILNMHFSVFDEASSALNITKCKTIGDCFCCFKVRSDETEPDSPPQPQDENAYIIDMLRFATLMHEYVHQCNLKTGEHLRLRVGISVGDISCVIFGTSAVTFDMFGLHAEHAESLEGTGIPGCIHVSDQVKSLTENRYSYLPRYNADETPPESRFSELGPTWIVKCKKGNPSMTVQYEDGVGHIAVETSSPEHDPQSSSGGSSSEIALGNINWSPGSAEASPYPSAISPSASQTILLQGMARRDSATSIFEQSSTLKASDSKTLPSDDDLPSEHSQQAVSKIHIPLLSRVTLIVYPMSKIVEFLRSDNFMALTEMRAGVITHFINLLALFLCILIRDTDRLANGSFGHDIPFTFLILIQAVCLVFMLTLAGIVCTPLGKNRVISYMGVLLVMCVHLVCTLSLFLDKRQFELHFEAYSLWMRFLLALCPFPLYVLFFAGAVIVSVLTLLLSIFGFIVYDLEVMPRLIVVPLASLIGLCAIRYVVTSLSLKSFWYQQELNRQILQTEQNQRENRDLILSVLPERVAARLQVSDENFAESLNGTVAFIYLRGMNFDTGSDEELGHLHTIFSHFDKILKQSDREVMKIKSVRSCYMVSSTGPGHAQTLLKVILEFKHYVESYNRRKSTSTILAPLGSEPEDKTHSPNDFEALSLSCGLHSGEFAGGVIGRCSFLYDIFSSTVNRSQRFAAAAQKCSIKMEKSFPGKFDYSCMLVSEDTKVFLESESHDGVSIQQEEDIYAKGFGMLQAYQIVEDKAPNRLRDTPPEGPGEHESLNAVDGIKDTEIRLEGDAQGRVRSDVRKGE